MEKFKKNPYREMDRPNGEDHPLDIIARSYISQTLIDQISIATKNLIKALGGDPRPWNKLEGLINEYRQQREELMFNLGHEHGVVACRVREASRQRHYLPDAGYHILAGEVRKQLVLSSLSSTQRVAVLLETALGLMMDERSR